MTTSTKMLDGEFDTGDDEAANEIWIRKNHPYDGGERDQ